MMKHDEAGFSNTHTCDIARHSETISLFDPV